MIKSQNSWGQNSQENFSVLVMERCDVCNVWQQDNAATDKSAKTSSSGGLHRNFGQAFVAMLKSGSGKLANFRFLLRVLAVPCVCGPLALIRFNSSCFA